MSKIAIVQPLIPHYREDFFDGLLEKYHIDIYVYRDKKEIEKSKMKNSKLNVKNLKTIDYKNKIRFYNILPLLSKKYSTIIVTAEVRTISVWILLILKKLLNKKVILWGHGISVPNYIEEESKMPSYKIFFHNMADQIWLYTKKEKEIWSKYLDKNKIYSLDNTINTQKILDYKIKTSKKELKNKYNITQETILIFSARFNSNYRRTDLLISTIETLDNKKFGFIIIGDGSFKPDFSKYENVYDFGATYDFDLKSELFSISDIYFQPGWVGLSIVEGMSYGLPIFTFKRTNEVKQCVEYYYINNATGFIATNFQEMIDKLININSEELHKYDCKNFVKDNLLIKNMIENTIIALKSINDR